MNLDCRKTFRKNSVFSKAPIYLFHKPTHYSSIKGINDCRYGHASPGWREHASERWDKHEPSDVHWRRTLRECYLRVAQCCRESITATAFSLDCQISIWIVIVAYFNYKCTNIYWRFWMKDLLCRLSLWAVAPPYLVINVWCVTLVLVRSLLSC